MAIGRSPRCARGRELLMVTDNCDVSGIDYVNAISFEFALLADASNSLPRLLKKYVTSQLFMKSWSVPCKCNELKSENTRMTSWGFVGDVVGPHPRPGPAARSS